MTHFGAAATAAKPFIDWAALGKVAGVSFVFGVAVVVLFSIGVVGWSWSKGRALESTDGPSTLAAMDAGAGAGTAQVAASRPGGIALASACFFLCASAVMYGLWLIIPQFHK